MKPPIYVRPLTDVERAGLRAGLRSPDAFTVRRCQLLLASADGLSPPQIARRFGCASATVRNALHAFAQRGLDCLHEQSSRPRSARPWLDDTFAESLRELLHHSPRRYGLSHSLWSLDRLAHVCYTLDWTPHPLSGEAIRQALRRLGIRWKRAKHWITSPDPAYQRKKHARDRLRRLAESHSDWVLGFQDETWWSRLALPAAHAWTGPAPLRLVQRAAAKEDRDPKALACYGLLRHDTGEMLLRFVQGRPVSQVTEDFLAWLCGELAREGKTALLLVWDNASWHISQRVRAWIAAHNRRVKQEGGVRLVVCGLPVKAPWLNPIEPKWRHGKEAIVEPERKLTAAETRQRICEYYHCEQLEPLEQKVA